MSRKVCTHTYDDIISIENLLGAWQEFLKGKRNRKDVQEFQLRLMDHIIDLHRDLANRTYIHSSYEAFSISDPKPRSIHKATVRDRLLHHALYRLLYPFFDEVFIADSFSCRKNKGTHRALKRFKNFSNKISQNNTKTAWVLKSDVRKFFATIDHQILMRILEKYIEDKEIIALMARIVGSFDSGVEGMGLPLGNLTSQLLVNVYMNECDHFVKHALRVDFYIRYADDFVVFNRSRSELIKTSQLIERFLQTELQLELHDHKTSIATLSSGIDFLGWVNFPTYRVLRTVTKRRMFKRVTATEGRTETVQSYIGLLGHGDGYELQKKIGLQNYDV
ncbi:MAG: RNA-directed DNA polymerase [Patiriisocius sp.]|jgi:RNA-directed DNA polymerase